MGDKRLMDNKVVKNPLLSGVDQTSFIQDFVQSTLIVPAAPPRILQTTTDETKSGPDKSEKKEIIVGENKTNAASVPNISSPVTFTNLGRHTESNQQLNQPIIFPPQQNISHIPTDKSTSLSEIPLNLNPTSVSFPKPPTSENTAANPSPASTPPPPLKTGGPPPLTSYNRPQSKLASSRYPSASFLQTIPSAQYFSQNNPNTSSVLSSNSLQNYPYSSSTTPVNYFVPQPQTQEQSVSFSTSSSSLNDTPIISSCPQESVKYNFPFFKSNGNLNDSIDTQTTNLFVPTTKSVAQEIDSSILTPVSIQHPILSSSGPPTLQNLTSEIQDSVSTSIPSLPVSQPVVIPSTSTVLFPSTSIGYSLHQSASHPRTSSVPSNSQSIISHSNSSDSQCTITTSSSSSVLRISTSSSPFLPSTVPISISPSSSTALQPSTTEDSAKYKEVSSKVEPFNDLEQASGQQILPDNSSHFSSHIVPPASSNSVLSTFLPSNSLPSEEKPLTYQVTSNSVENFANQPSLLSSGSNIPVSFASSSPESKVAELQHSADGKTVEAVSTHESVNQPIPAAALFTFPNSTSSSNFSDSLAPPPNLPYNENNFSILGKQNKPFSVSAANLTAPLLSKDQVQPPSSAPVPPISELTTNNLFKSNVPFPVSTADLTAPLVPKDQAQPLFSDPAPSTSELTTNNLFKSNQPFPVSAANISAPLLSKDQVQPPSNAPAPLTSELTTNNLFKSNRPFSISADNITAPSSIKDQVQHLSSTPVPPTSESTSVTSSSTVPFLDPSKFFTTSPPLTQQFLNPSPQLNSSKPADPPTYPPLPVRNFTTPSSPCWQHSYPPSFPKPETVTNKGSSQDTSIASRSSPIVTSSHTPPPPYSSLSPTPYTADQGSNLTQSQTDGGTTIQPDNISTVKEEELDQIPLDGNTVPLYNPRSVKTVGNPNLAQPSLGSSNTYRLGSGLKRPSYAPVPDLGISHQVVQAFPMMSGSPTIQSSPTTTANDKMPSATRSSSVTSNSPPSETTQFHYSVTAQGQHYRPAYHHWFYKKGSETKSIWRPFSMADSLNLEQVFTSPDLDENTKVPTDGGRYDVEVLHRRKVPVYWEEPPGEVRRCSWFVRAPIESRYIPYDENIAEILEDAYKTGCLRNEWNRRVELADGEVIILHSPNAMVHHQRSSSPDAWGNPPTMPQKPRIVKRGLEDFEISEGEPNQVDHLLLMVHGIGKVCDLRFRSLVQVVDDFRCVSLQLVQSHFRTGTQNGNVGRVEVLPVEWHRALHTETIDKRLSDITLPSIPKAREFTNDVLLDILFYTSPVFCERIVQAVGTEINRVYNLYMARNPGFRGGVSLGGHSLGSLILFDMLCHQRPQTSLKSSYSTQSSSIQESDEDMPELGCLKTRARLSRRMSYLTIAGSAGTGQPYIAYPQLNFQPKAFFALGSPIGMFLTVRGLEGLGEEFKFPTCPKFFNIFHPNDPVAYRIEALVSPEMVGIPAVVIPHHKGRKRMHLELKETMTHVTAALKQKLIDSMRSTWNTVYQLAMFQRPDSSIQQEVDKVIENEILTNTDCENTSNQLVMSEQEALNLKVGSLNGGDRIDYVLQEAPLETFNQYISAVRSHVVYWESEDTMLLILKELYATIGISPDSQVPQPILPFDLSSETGNETYSEYTDSIGAPPTQFIRK